MKKLVSLLLIVLLICSCCSGLLMLTSCSSTRAITLRIANQGEYMDPEIYMGFADWYKEQTGEEVIIEYKEFDTCETLYTWIALKHEDYDLICPSDYMLERMNNEGLLLTLDDDTLHVLNETINPTIIEMVKNSYSPDFSYSCPYMWGTLGIMFNVNSDGEEGLQQAEYDRMNTWEAIWSEDFLNKIFMKDSVRDAYSIAMIYAKRQELMNALGEEQDYSNEEYQAILKDIFDATNEEKIETAKQALMAQKPNVYDYEVDSAKDEMLRDVDGEKGYIGLFWSCDAGYVMTGEEEEADTNPNLYYIVPKEGSNVWVDSFAIPKYAKNTKAANMFLQYLCDPDIAYANMDYVGCTSAVLEGAENYKADLMEDEEFFEGKYEGYKEMYMELLFPSEELLQRCAIMKDFGKYNHSLDEMWIDVLLS